MFVPWMPVGVPPLVDVPRSRVRTSAIERSVVRSRFGDEIRVRAADAADALALQLGRRPASRKRSSQTTSLASSRSACSASSAASPVVFDVGFAANVVGEPLRRR